jgi:hypothetical protein
MGTPAINSIPPYLVATERGMYTPPKKVDFERLNGLLEEVPLKAVQRTMPSVVTEGHLKKINPTFNARGRLAFPEASAEMFAKTGFVKPVAKGSHEYITTKPLKLGAGVSIPVGTRVSDQRGPSGQVDGQGRAALAYRLSFAMPNGKTLTMISRHLLTDRPTTELDFGDKSKGSFQFVGAPFFNPKTGTLTRVVPDRAGGGAPSTQKFQLHSSMMDASFAKIPASNVVRPGPNNKTPMTGRDAQAAIRTMMQGNAPATPAPQTTPKMPSSTKPVEPPSIRPMMWGGSTPATPAPLPRTRSTKPVVPPQGPVF